MKSKKVLVALLSVFASVASVSAIAACSDNEERQQGGEETGVYYCVDGGQEYSITLNTDLGVTFIVKDVVEKGVYTLEGDKLSLVLNSDQSETISAIWKNDELTLTYDNAQLTFLKKISYRVDFQTGSDVSVPSVTVINGQMVEKPADPELSGFAFLGWYADSTCKIPYTFGTEAIRSNTTLYAGWAQTIPGKSEYVVNLDLNYSGAQSLEAVKTIGGKLYNLPTPVRDGYTFAGWWISDYQDATKISYQYDEDMTFSEDDTLFALWKSNSSSEVMLNVTSSQITWDKLPSSGRLQITDPDGKEIYNDSIGATASNTLSFDFASKSAGDYVITLTYGSNNTVKRYYKNKALDRVSSFTVLQNSVLLFNSVAHAEKYLITVECGNDNHNHTEFDNGLSTNFNFVNCDMAADGIKFTVTAIADGYASSVSEAFVYNRLLDQVTGYSLDEGEQLLVWDAVPYAAEYVVTVKSGETTSVYNVGNENSFSLKPYTGALEISVYPKTDGYNSPAATSFTYTKQELATPTELAIVGDTLTWNEVEGATSYTVTIGNVTVSNISGTSLNLKETTVNWTEGSDYTIQVRAEGTKASYPSDTLDARYYALYSSLKYNKSVVSWRSVIGADKYEVSVNGTLVNTIENGVCQSEITLTKEGTNVISVRFSNEDTTSDWVSISVNAYVIDFDSRGGEEVASVYKAIGDKLDLPESTRTGYDFAGWYNVPGGATSNGAEYQYANFNGNGNTTVYAFWTPKTYTVQLNVGEYGELADETADVVYTKGYQLPVPKVTDGMRVFRGWCSVESGNGIMYTDELGNSLSYWNHTEENVTLYAYYVEAIIFVEEDDGYTVKKNTYINQISNLVIPAEYNGKKVVRIDEYGFKSCTTLTSVSIPDTIRLIPFTAFDGCTKITSFEVRNEGGIDPVYSSKNGTLLYQNVMTSQTEIAAIPAALTGAYTVPEGVTSLVQGTFKNSKFTSIVIPSSVVKVASGAFTGCTKLTTITFENATSTDVKALTVEDDAFDGCTALQVLNLPARLNEFSGDVTTIFSQFTKLTQINVEETSSNVAYASIDGVLCNAKKDTILYCPLAKSGVYTVPAGVLYIGANAFNSYDTKTYGLITEVIFHSNIAEIGEKAFYGCGNLTKVTFQASQHPNGFTIGKQAFYGCGSLETITFEETGALNSSYVYEYTTSCGVEEIGEQAFYGCKETSIVLPSTLTKIGNNAFQKNTALSSVDFSHVSNALEYGDYIFNGCSSLKNVELTNNVGVMPINTVFYKSGLTSVTVSQDNPNYYSGDDGVLYSKDKERIIYYPAGLTGDYVIPEYVKYIDGGVFLNVDNITSITISRNIVSIGASAFEGCENLKTITFEEGGSEALEIGEKAFYNCAQLESVTLPARTKSIGDSSFCQVAVKKNALTSITLNEGLESIGNYAFSRNDKVTSITIPSSVKSIGNYAFSFMGLTSINFESTPAGKVVESLELGNSVFISTLIEEINLPERLLYIPTYAFNNCANLTKVTIPTSVGNCTVTKDGTATRYHGVESYAFYNCAALTEIEFTKGGTNDLSFGKYAFEGCTALTELNLPNRISGFNSSYDVFYMGDTSYILENANVYYYTSRVSTTGAANSNIANINVEEGGKNFSSYDGVLYTANRAEVVLCPNKSGVVEIAKEATTFRECAFYGCQNVTGIIFEEGGTADFEVKDLTSASLGSSTTTNVFYGCWSLTSIHFPARLTKIGDYSFALYTGVSTTVNGVKKYYSILLDDVTFAEGCKLTELGSYAFQKQEMKSIALPNNITTIGTKPFDQCASLATITVGTNTDQDMLEAITTGASGLTKVIIPEDNTAISAETNGIIYSADKSTLVYCPADYSGDFEVPATVTKIADYAFQNVSGLKAVTFADSVLNLEIGAYAFSESGITSIVLPKRLNSYGLVAGTANGYTFNKCASLTSVTFEEGYNYATIPNYMFYNCTALTKIDLPYQVSLIGSFAFYGCSKLASISFADAEDTNHTSQLQYIGQSAFYGCSVLNNVVIPDSVLMIGANITSSSAGAIAYPTYGNAFYGCKALTNITLPANLTVLAAQTFYGCTALVGIELPDSLTGIGNSAFYGCTKLATIVIPSKVESIGQQAFSGCTALYSVDLSSATVLETLGSQAFYKCTSTKFTSIDLSKTKINAVADSTFEGCTKLATITLPDTVVSFGKNAFKTCTVLKTFHVPTALASIGSYAFSGCAALTSFEIPANVSVISSYAFDGCTNLTSITIGANITEIGSFAFQSSGLTKIVIPDSDSAITLGTYAFTKCTSLTEATIPLNRITAIPNSLFSGCSKLATVTFTHADSSTVTSIGTSAFASTAITAFEIPATVTTIGYSAFDSSKLKSITIPANVTTIDYKAFFNVTTLTSVTIEARQTADLVLKNIGAINMTNAGVFGKCTALTAIDLTYVSVVGPRAFEGCTSLTTVTRGGDTGVTATIGLSAFSGCTKLTTIQLENVEFTYLSSATATKGTASTKVFQNCSALTNISFVKGAEGFTNYITTEDTTMIQYMFSGCTKLADVNFGNYETIETYAFEKCTTLTSVSLSDSVTTLKNNVFNGATSITEVYLNNLESLGTTVFSTPQNITFTTNPNNTTTLALNGGIYINNVLTLYYGTGESFTIPEGTKSITASAFSGNTVLKTVSFPSSLTEIGEKAFQNCTALTSVTIPAQVRIVGSNVFNGCTALTEATINIDGDLTKASGYWFQKCTSLQTVTFAAGITTFQNYMFDGCTSLTDVTLPSTLTSWGSYFFQNCSSLVSVTLPSGLTDIGAYNFNGCSSLESVVKEGEKITKIGNYAFQGCAKLTADGLFDMSEVASIGSYAFKGCTSISSLTFTSATTAIGSNAFNGWTATQSIILGYAEEELPSGYNSAWKTGCSATITYAEASAEDSEQDGE